MHFQDEMRQIMAQVIKANLLPYNNELKNPNIIEDGIKGERVSVYVYKRKKETLCVCVCVYKRKRERERENDTKRV